MYGNVHEEGRVLMEVERQLVHNENNDDPYFATVVDNDTVLWNANNGESFSLGIPYYLRGTTLLQRKEVPGLFVRKTKGREPVCVWHIRDGEVWSQKKLVAEFNLPQDLDPTNFFDLADGRTIAFFMKYTERYIFLCEEQDGKGVFIPLPNPFGNLHLNNIQEIEHGKVLVRFENSFNVGLWNIDTGSAHYDFLVGHTQGVTDVVVSLDKQSVVTCSKEGFFIWRTRDGVCIGKIELSIVNVRVIKPLRDNRFIAATLFRSDMQLLEDALIEINIPSVSSSSDFCSEELFSLYVGDNKEITAMTEMEDGSFLCGLEDKSITRWCFSRRCIVQSYPQYRDSVCSIMKVNENTFVAFQKNDEGGLIRSYGLQENERDDFSFEVGPVENTESLFIRLKNGNLAGFLKFNSVSIWSLQGKHLQTLVDPDIIRQTISICELDDKRLVTGCLRGQIKVWCLGDDENQEKGCVKTLGTFFPAGNQSGAVVHLAKAKKKTVTREGRLLVESVVVSCSWSGRVIVWDLEAECKVTEFSHLDNESFMEPINSSGSYAGSGIWKALVTGGSWTAMTLLEDQTLICTYKRGLTKTWDLTGRCLSSFSFVSHPFPLQFPEVRKMMEAKDGRLILGYQRGMIKVVRRPVRYIRQLYTYHALGVDRKILLQSSSNVLQDHRRAAQRRQGFTSLGS